MAPRKKCSTCGSRQWRKNAAGLVTCSEGHVLQHYINESEEVDDAGTHMMRKRALKSNRKKKDRMTKADPKLYHGDRARFHYYQCLQLLFRTQVQVLIVLWNLPLEFETICRDLWTLYLNLIPNPPPAEPFYCTREQEGHHSEPEDDRRKARSRSPHENEDGARSREGIIEPDEKSPSSDDELPAPEIATLLDEISEVSSSDDGSSSDEPRARNDAYVPPKKSFACHADRPENTIALLVLACWSIRLPVVYMDFISAIESYSLPYLDHVRSLPPSLARHLTKHAVQALSPHYAPKTSSLHRLAAHLANRIYNAFDIVIPELNAAPVLWRVVQECFCGTPMLYALTKRVGNILSLELSLQDSSLLSLSGARGGDSQAHDNSAPPEVSLVATAVIVLKLVYGLDGKARFPRNSDDAAWAFPAADEFLAAVHEVDVGESCLSSHRFGSRATLSVGDLEDTALDDYLGFCQKVLVDPKRDEETERVIGNYFPLASEAADLTQSEPPSLRGRGLLSTRRHGDGGGALEPGEKYTIYDAKDVLGNLSGDLKMIMERSARWAGIDCDVMCGVVERYERRLLRWWHKARQGQEGD